jgi:hypothetical protein
MQRSVTLSSPGVVEFDFFVDSEEHEAGLGREQLAFVIE